VSILQNFYRKFTHTDKKIALQAVTIPLKLSYKIEGKLLYFTTMVLNKWLVFLLLCIGCFVMDKIQLKKNTLTYHISKNNSTSSFRIEDVANIAIEKPNTSFTLQETIDYLNSKTLLNFKALDDRYVTVSKQNNISLRNCFMKRNLV
jgi:hypothetical protein